MIKYFIKRLLYGLVSIVIVIGIVMVLIYSILDRTTIFQNDSTYTKSSYNVKEEYKYRKWEEYGYVEYVSYVEYLDSLVDDGTIPSNLRNLISNIGKDPLNTKESDITNIELLNKIEALGYDVKEIVGLINRYTNDFKEKYEDKGYTIYALKYKRVSGSNDGAQKLFAAKDINIITRLFNYFANILEFDSINYVKEDIKNRGIKFTFYDPVYGGDKFSPAIIGNGTKHKYLLYFDSKFPYIHQNIMKINLGTSYSILKSYDVFEIFTDSQGSDSYSKVIYPTGYEEISSDDLHTATYLAGSNNTAFLKQRFLDDYTQVKGRLNSFSRMGFSFIIGIIASLITYIVAIPLGILMARFKNRFIDKLGTFYIVFIMAVPSLAYILMLKNIGGNVFNLPTIFEASNMNVLMYILPIISLSLPTVANIMKWLRRYMIDQMNSGYVKFAKSSGLNDDEIFNKHILKNSIIPIIHGIPSTLLGSLTGAIITERIYSVPGTGNLLTEAINKYDNSVIVGVALFYALLSVLSIILGDMLISKIDPRIALSKKG